MNMMGDAGGSEALFEEVVRTSPEYFPAQFSLGVIRQSQGRHDDAVERFSAAIAQRSDYAEAHLRLAVSLRHLGRPKDALPHYQQVIAANPQNSEALFGYATTLAQLHRDHTRPFTRLTSRVRDWASASPYRFLRWVVTSCSRTTRRLPTP